ncbi:replication/maintenance protein RepL [Helicobacter bizzozeronii]|uniref:replication/maintenance protein RepL n=1 Tax=Helicobacter bizzozeronii TaxID=56877 RepID=UPI000CEE57B3|nr:replication/maintenance protein RepL [Helicobacter bizzozeronii]
MKDNPQTANTTTKGRVKSGKIKNAKTTKLQRIETRQEIYIKNIKTGEIQESDALICDAIVEKDCNFDKLFTGMLFHILGEIGGALLRACVKVIELRDRENSVFVTSVKLAKLCDVSLDTAKRALKILVEKKVLQPLTARGGAYRVNGNMIFKGGYESRRTIVFRFHEREEEILQEKTTKATTSTKKPKREKKKGDEK